jgi:hypothetical protein
MSRILQITQEKPNPAGKDKAGDIPKPEQLLAEWVDIKNVGIEAVPVSSISLSHTLFDRKWRNTNQTEVYRTGGNESLQPNKAVRVRTGNFKDKNLINPSDDTGNDWNSFANKDNFVLNNRCGDTITVVWTNAVESKLSDTAPYDANQPKARFFVTAEINWH